MSVDHTGLTDFQARLEALRDDMPEIMDGLAVGEGLYARDQAREICKEEKLVNTGAYRLHFKSGKKAIRAGNSYKIDVFNNLEYAKMLEYGFRSHFVPGHWEGNTFVYQKKDPDGGMYVGPGGGYVRGNFVLLRAIRRTKDSQTARLRRRMKRILLQRTGGDEDDTQQLL